jgi:hypothetical protein
VRYCVSRIERELGEIEHWSVSIAPAGGEFASIVAIKDAADRIESTGIGMDGPLAAWDALCKLEQLLREARACRAADGAFAAATTFGATRPLTAADDSGAG